MFTKLIEEDNKIQKELERRKEKLLIAKEHAESKGGKCLSSVYINGDSILDWECYEGHRWPARFRKVVGENQWCKKCLHESLKVKDALNKAKKYAVEKGGNCLSSEYINIKRKLKWVCAGSHEWESSFEEVVNQKHWCSICSNYYYKEHKIRSLFEYIFNDNFKKSRPKWNINPKTNTPLELDGYNKDYKLAFEFQGVQHYELGGFNKTQEDLDYIIEKDGFKKTNCLKMGVRLLVIDDIFDIDNADLFIDYILSLLKENKIIITKKLNKDEMIEIFLKNQSKQVEFLGTAKEYAKSKGGLCLSNNYLNNKTKLLWKCDKGHEWHSTYDSVRRGSWCSYCDGKFSKEEGLNKSKEMAIKNGGLCLSAKYKNARTKLLWKCAKNHEWESTYDNVRSGGWCKLCKK